ncbi:hypothetical protein G9A89_008255 [Geosiphon pyriformis]|nr:hypothetical protein G9A89_008255 [Geosiphon pyriformis]
MIFLSRQKFPTSDYVNLQTMNQQQQQEKTRRKKKYMEFYPYIPPEVLRGEKCTSDGDIYSFAMLLWELATGKLPFHDCKHDQILIMDILNGIRPMITSPIIPPSIAKIIVKCWDGNPKNRPTAKKVWFDLHNLFNMYDWFRIKSRYEETVKGRQFLESYKYVKEMVKIDLTVIPSTTLTLVHPGAVYTSRILTAQLGNLSKG